MKSWYTFLINYHMILIYFSLKSKANNIKNLIATKQIAQVVDHQVDTYVHLFLKLIYQDSGFQLPNANIFKFISLYNMKYINA